MKNYFYYFGNGKGRYYPSLRPVYDNAVHAISLHNVQRYHNEDRYKYDLEAWQSSGKDCKVNEEQDRIMHIKCLAKYQWDNETKDFEEYKSEGIYIEGVRIKEENRCSNRCDWPKCTFADCMEKHPEEWVKGKQLYAFLEPVEAQEDETDIWTEIIDMVDDLSRVSEGYSYVINRLKDKFTINRKQQTK